MATLYCGVAHSGANLPDLGCKNDIRFLKPL